ncbi:MAG: hypothetical protein WCO57_05400, partial [Verrucomicrobiota bacterium]
ETEPHFFADGTRRAYNCHMGRIHIKSRPLGGRDGQFTRFSAAGNRILRAHLAPQCRPLHWRYQ